MSKIIVNEEEIKEIVTEAHMAGQLDAGNASGYWSKNRGKIMKTCKKEKKIFYSHYDWLDDNFAWGEKS